MTLLENRDSAIPRMRYHLLDTIRGFALFFMILYHTLWDLQNLFYVSLPFFKPPFTEIWQQVNCAVFILLSGFCQPLGRKKLRHALTVFIAGAAVSVVTLVAMPSAAVKFGILTMLGSAMLLMLPLSRVFSRIPPFVGFAASLLLFLLLHDVMLGYVGFYGVRLFQVPAFFYANDGTAYLGFPQASFFSGDYFPLIPWLFLFFAGYFLHAIFRKYGLFRYLERGRLPFINRCGRLSLWIYVAHQPVIYAVLTVIFTFIIR